MITTIQQCNYAGTHTFDGKNIIHSGIKYSILQGGEAHVYTQQQRGNYKRNNLSENSTMYSGEVFFATLNNNGSYAYSVMGEHTDDNYIVIENNESIQAVVLPNGKIAAVFYEPGSFDYGGKTGYHCLWSRCLHQIRFSGRKCKGRYVCPQGDGRPAKCSRRSIPSCHLPPEMVS